MASKLRAFERIVRQAHNYTEAPARASADVHPFDDRNVHSDLPEAVRRLFDNGHYAQATFEAFKFIDEEVQRIAGSTDFGTGLMMKAFGGIPPALPLNAGATPSEQNEQEGYKFLFAGAMLGIRNPRGHSTGMQDDPDSCLDHLSFCSMLLRRLDEASLR